MLPAAHRAASQPLPRRRQREALATPLGPMEQRALADQVSHLLRPSWALPLSAFTAQAPPPQQAPPQQAPPAGQPAGAAPPVLPQPLAF